MISIGILLNLLEIMLPQPLPWVKYGFAQIVSILALYFFNTKTALFIVFIRLAVMGMIRGGWFNPLVLITFISAFCAVLAMSFCKNKSKAGFSIIGVSVTGSFVFNSVQLILSWQLIIHHGEFIHFFPVTAGFSVFTGLLTGYLALYLYESLKNRVFVKIRR